MANLREAQLDALKAAPLDVLILGGGINGAGIARDLALRATATGTALRVGLVEQRQFGSGTSGKNSQLIHGGLRYLKGLEFGLVRESLRERATLLSIAPDSVRPLAFLMPFYGHAKGLYYRAGLTLYDLLAGSHRIHRHKALGRTAALATEPGLARAGLTGAATFWDAAVHSARFVLANIADARRYGVVTVNYLRAEAWARGEGGWRVTLTDLLSGVPFEVRARKLVDTLGPWSGAAKLRLVRGSHIVLPRLTAGGHGVAHFNPDGRILFVIPWGESRPLSLVGTTDVDHEGGADDVDISPQETEYLLEVVRALFPAARDTKPIAAFSALRALPANSAGPPSAASRDHRIWESGDGILHVAAGKYTTYRAMSEEGADRIARDVAPGLDGVHLTGRAPIPGDQPPAAVDERIGFAVERDMSQRLSDLLFVSTYWGYEQEWTRESLAPLAEGMGRLLGWDHRRCQEEIDLVSCQRERF